MKEKTKRKYYEVWGDTLNLLNFFRTLTIALVGIIIFLVVMLRQATKRPPLLIRVDKIGQAQAVKDWANEILVSPPEIVNFTQTFMELFTAYDFYTYDNMFKKAFKMMTLEYQRKADEYLQTKRIVEGIKQAQYKIKLNISKIEIVKDSPEATILKVKGYREVRSYANPDFYKEVVFESEVALRKVQRTYDTPWGLLVDAYNETVIKEK